MIKVKEFLRGFMPVSFTNGVGHKVVYIVYNAEKNILVEAHVEDEVGLNGFRVATLAETNKIEASIINFGSELYECPDAFGLSFS